MKHITSLIIIFTFAMSNVYSQNTKEETEIIEIINTQDSIPRNVFLDSTLLANMTSRSMNTRQMWYSINRTEKHIDQLFDIRIKFENHDAALKFHKKYLKTNSEEGPEIKKHKIKSEGAEEFKVFKGEKTVNALVENFGLQMYCYLFVVGNYFVKVYITCSKDYKPNKFQNLVSDIISRIKNNSTAVPAGN